MASLFLCSIASEIGCRNGTKWEKKKKKKPTFAALAHMETRRDAVSKDTPRDLGDRKTGHRLWKRQANAHACTCAEPVT